MDCVRTSLKELGTGEEGRAYRNEEIGNLSFIFEPRFAVLGAAAGDVSMRAVGNHASEEDGVEPGEGTPVSRKESERLAK